MTANATTRTVDPAFLALTLELDPTVDAALQQAAEAGAEFADVRVMASTSNDVALHDLQLQSAAVNRTLGVGIRVLLAGSWGFAATTDLSIGAVHRATRRAVELAQTMTVGAHPVTLAAEASYRGSWCSPYELDPTTVDLTDVLDTLGGWASRLLASEVVAHVEASFTGVKEQVLYANSGGTRVVQQRVRCHPIVARLAHLHDPVAATLELAARAATVAIDGVAVIAAFTGPFEPVATDIVQTGLEAC